MGQTSVRRTSCTGWDSGAKDFQGLFWFQSLWFLFVFWLFQSIRKHSLNSPYFSWCQTVFTAYWQKSEAKQNKQKNTWCFSRTTSRSTGRIEMCKTVFLNQGHLQLCFVLGSYKISTIVTTISNLHKWWYSWHFSTKIPKVSAWVSGFNRLFLSSCFYVM